MHPPPAPPYFLCILPFRHQPQLLALRYLPLGETEEDTEYPTRFPTQPTYHATRPLHFKILAERLVFVVPGSLLRLELATRETAKLYYPDKLEPYKSASVKKSFAR
jgi:hypothetical protein